MEFGKRVRQTRKDQGMTQSELANALGTSQSAVSQIEAGERNPTYDMIRRLADQLNVSAGYLMGGDVKGEDVDELSPQEEAHFRQLRGLSEEGREELREYMQYLRFQEKRRRQEQAGGDADGDEP